MRRIAITVVSVLGATVALGATAVPALATNLTPGQKTSSSTTLDACGYFMGTQTANKTEQNGAVSSENGTWTGVSNAFGEGPVASLGTVHGSYTETTTTNSDGSITTGTETFHSNAGEIDQTFSFGSGVPGGFSVTVTATRSLSFLTSSTDGACYSGPFPRP
jgi:hypothetical protein